jgi:hypothetical protein
MKIKNTFGLIKNGVTSGKLNLTFRGGDVNLLLGIYWGGTFLSKHTGDEGKTNQRWNSRGYTVFFKRIKRGVYQLIHSS